MKRNLDGPVLDSAADERTDDAELTMPLEAGLLRGAALPEADALDPAVVGPAGFKPINQGTLLLLLIVLVAAGSLYGMRLSIGTLTGAVPREVETRIEKALQQLAGRNAAEQTARLTPIGLEAMFQDTDAIVVMFSFDVTQRQIPPEQVKKNPFKLAITPPKADSTAATPDAEARRQAELEARRRRERDRIDAELKTLTLQTVMHGRMPVAIISGQFVKPGQTLGSFTIKAIDHMTVRLGWGDEEFVLSMDGGGKK